MTTTLERPTATPLTEAQNPWEAVSDTTPTTSNEIVEQPQRSELSPMASRIRNAANRVAKFLEQRALNAAHSDALKEYRTRDHSGYIDHLANVSVDPTNSEEATSYAQGELNRENFAADFHESVDHAREAVTHIGRSALHAAQETGLVVLGASVAVVEGAKEAAQAARRSVKTVGFRANMAAESLAGRIKTNVATSILNGKAALEGRQRDVSDAKDMLRAKYEDVRFSLSMRKKAALERVAARGKALKEGVRTVLGQTKEKVESLKNQEVARAHVYRAAGKAALDAFRKTRATHNDQNELDR